MDTLVLVDTGCHLKNLPRAMANRDNGERESREFVLSTCLDNDDGFSYSLFLSN